MLMVNRGDKAVKKMERGICCKSGSERESVEVQ
jgi:hypothetical protein